MLRNMLKAIDFPNYMIVAVCTTTLKSTHFPGKNMTSLRPIVFLMRIGTLLDAV
jgi:hypothetical protein